MWSNLNKRISLRPPLSGPEFNYCTGRIFLSMTMENKQAAPTAVIPRASGWCVTGAGTWHRYLASALQWAAGAPWGLLPLEALARQTGLTGELSAGM